MDEKEPVKRERERLRWENKNNACVCVIFCHCGILEDRGSVCLDACVRVCVRVVGVFVRACVCVFEFASPSTQFVELIPSLIVSKTKSHPNPTTIYNTEGREQWVRLATTGMRKRCSERQGKKDC